MTLLYNSEAWQCTSRWPDNPQTGALLQRRFVGYLQVNRPAQLLGATGVHPDNVPTNMAGSQMLSTQVSPLVR